MIDSPRPNHMDRYSSRPRIGAVSYLNSKPLIAGLTDWQRSGALTLDLPSRLADNLARGNLDVALIPSVEAFSDPDYEVVSDACVATHGPVLSVKLYSRVQPGEIRTLALDEGSRTSAALSQVILHERYGVRPKLERLPIGDSIADSTADAVLLIGDRAMFPQPGTYQAVWDLGEEWVNWTGLPFVFAMWVTRRGQNLGHVPNLLSEARDIGVASLADIAKIGASELGISHDIAYKYLTKNLHFRFGNAERMGLQLFHELAANIGLAREHDLAYRDVTVVADRIEALVTSA